VCYNNQVAIPVQDNAKSTDAFHVYVCQYDSIGIEAISGQSSEMKSYKEVTSVTTTQGDSTASQYEWIW
jgi:hypothetical protein